MMEAIARYPRDVRGQINYFLFNYQIPASTGRLRGVSFKTVEAYQQSFHQLYTDLGRLHIRIDNLGELTLRQVIKVVQYWERSGQSAHSLMNKWTHVKRLLHWIGKPPSPGARDLSRVLVNPSRASRTTSAITARTPESVNVDVVEFLNRMQASYPLVHVQLLLQYEFGLRVREALALRPGEADAGAKLVVTRGTKGGRPRTVPIDSTPKRQALELAKQLAATREDTLSDLSLSLEQNRNRYQYILKKLGMTKRDLGFTSHGLRRAYAIARYEIGSGVKAPVRGGVQVSEECELGARLMVAQELGHSRTQITSAYVGSVRRMNRVCKLNLEHWIAALESDAQLCTTMSNHRAGARLEGHELSLLLVGPQAVGVPFDERSVVVFVLTIVSIQNGKDTSRGIDPKSLIRRERISIELGRSIVRSRFWNAACDLEADLQRVLQVRCRVLGCDEWNAQFTDAESRQTLEILFDRESKFEHSMSNLDSIGPKVFADEAPTPGFPQLFEHGEA